MILPPKTTVVLAALLALQSPVRAQGVQYDTAPANTSPASDASSKPGPGALVEKSVRDLSRGDVAAAVHDDVTALQRGPLLIHGNYCGVGNRPGTRPTDALDVACARHDSCTKTGDVPNCACDDRLQAESVAIARDPRQPPELQALAAATAASMAVLICK